MPQNNKNHQKNSGQNAASQARLHAAALRLAAAHGWVDLTVAEVYAAADLPLPQHSLNDGPAIWDLVDDILASLDDKVASDVDSRLGPVWRDNLFELIMTRFDLMQPDRLAYADIMPAAVTRACAAAPRLSSRFVRTMDDMVSRAQIPVSRLGRPVIVTAVTGIYLTLVETWRQDDTPDLAKTMAAVDKRIGWIERLLQNAALSDRQA